MNTNRPRKENTLKTMPEIAEKAITLYLKSLVDVPLPRNVYLFGPCARGEIPETEVSLDLALIVEDPSDERDPLRYLLAKGQVGAAVKVLNDLEVFIEPHIVSADQWDHPELASDPWLIEEIRREGIEYVQS